MAGKSANIKTGKELEHKRYRTAMVFYRWLFLVFAVVFLATSQRSKALSSYVIVETAALAIVYNLVVSAGMLKCRNIDIRIPTPVIYIDIAILALLSFLSGGMKSDIYILLLFVLFFCGILCSTTHTIGASIACVVFYTASSIFAYKLDSGYPNIPGLVAKDALILLGAYGICQIRNQVTKSDELRRKEFRLARTDRLTGLANRHYFDHKLIEEAKYADKTGGRLNILIFDLDNFKRFNDTYGHVAGDKLLALFADIIKQNIRDTDIPVRYGGEEFLLLVRDLDIVIAKSVGDRIRWQLEKQKIYMNDASEKHLVTVSCGVAQYPCDSKDIKESVELADRALYHAKENGRNSVYTYNEICSRGA